ncbi:UNVERIFIED_CONTAM: hypothetical protein FKN15_011852 [Acipenser sinensis]
MGSPRHQTPLGTNQQPPQQKGPNQQLGAGQAQQQKPPTTQGSASFSPAKHHGVPTQDKPPAQAMHGVVSEAHKQQQAQEKDRMHLKSGKEAVAPAVSKETNKRYNTQDLSRSPQSQSDTGYSSDGISGSQSEITGLIQEEEMILNKRGIVEHSPPSPSELTKLESTMRPLLESKSVSGQEQGGRGKQHHHHDPREEQKQKQRPRSLSITPEAFDSDEELEDILEEDEGSVEWEHQRDQRDSVIESSDDFSSKLRHDYVEDSSESGFSPLPGRQRKAEPEITDEEFMRRQIMEMSAEEDNLDEDEGYGYPKPKKSHKHSTDSGKESKRRLPHNSSSLYEEEGKGTGDAYKGTGVEGEEDLMASQGGLRRFKTIDLNNTNSYGREMELSNENDLSLDREPELEMESLTGSPDERSRGEYSSTLPPTTPSYTSGTSPTSVSSMEEDSDSSPSRRQRLEEAKQQRKARHRSHGPLLPTIEDSSEEEELREEEELLREQEKMREVEQQRIRSTARKTKRDKEELRAQRRRERSKTPPSNLSPIEDASPTEELRQAAEMEELHRSSCSEYSPSIDSEAEGFEMIASKLYKSGSEYNLPTFMSLYSPTEKPTTTSASSASKPLKSAEEAYEEMMRKAEMLQKQQKQQTQQLKQGQAYSNTYQQEDFRSTGQQDSDQYQYEDNYGYGKDIGSSQTAYQNNISKAENIYEEILQTSQSISKMQQQKISQITESSTYQDKQLLDTGSVFAKLLEQSSAPLTPGTSPTQLSAPVSFSGTSGNEPGGTGTRGIPDVHVTQHFSKEAQKERAKSQGSSVGATSTAVTTIASYVVYGRESTATTQVIASQTATSSSYGRQSAATSTASAFAGCDQGYSQRDSITGGKRVQENRGVQARDSSQVKTEAGSVNLTSKSYYYKGSSPPISPSSSPTQSPTHSPSSATSPVIAQGTQTPHRASSPRLFRQQSSQGSPFMVITLGSDTTSPGKPLTVNSSTSPVSSPTRLSRQQTLHGYDQSASSSSSPQHQQQQQSPHHPLYKSQADRVSSTTASTYNRGSLSMENISLCRISTVPGTSRVEQGPRLPSGSVVDLRIATKPYPVIMTDKGMDLTSIATESRRFSLGSEESPSRHSTTVQPLIMNLNAQEQPHVATSTPTTVSITVAASMFTSQPKQPMVYGNPFQNRVDFGQGSGSAMCLTQTKQPAVNAQDSIPKIDAKLEDLGIQQHKLQQQQQHLQQQQQHLQQQLQHHQQQQQHLQQQQAMFSRYNLANQVQPVVKKDMKVSQTSSAQTVVSVSAIPRAAPLPDQPVPAVPIPPAPPLDLYSNVNLELKTKTPAVNLLGVKPNVMMVQVDNASQGATITQFVKPDEPHDALDFTGIKSENQVACCDVVYKFPFGGSCTGAFSQPPEKASVPVAELPQSNHQPSAPQYYGNRKQEQSQESYQYREQPESSHGFMDDRKIYPLPFSGRLSMSDTNLAEAGLNYNQIKNYSTFHGPGGDLAVDLSTVKQPYSGSFSDGEYLGLGMQYGSYTDLRHQGDVMSQPLPMRRYNSMSNINTDYGYSPRDLSNFQESSLAQYSATTAREISRMCAALNSMDQFAGRYANNPDLLQYASTGAGGAGARLNLLSGQQGLSAMKANLMYGPNFSEGRQDAHGQAFGNLPQYNVSSARLAGIRHMYPSGVRAADGMIYSTINTPIASTLPITTQPASVLRPMIRGLYRPYPPGNMTAVPLASLAGLPLVTPRMPLSSQGPYRYPPPNRFTTAPVTATTTTNTTALDTPVYLGRPSGMPAAPNTINMGMTNMQAGRAPTTVMMRFPVVCDQTGRILQHEVPPELQRTVGQNGQYWQPYVEGGVIQGVIPPRPLPSSASEMSLRNEEHVETRGMKKRNSMPRLRDGIEFEEAQHSVKRIADSSAQTDDEDGEEKYYMSRRRRARRSVDCSVQTDDEDNEEWEQPVRRRRSRFSKHSDSGSESKSESSKGTSSIAIQTISDSSCQTDPDQLGRVSPAIHITTPDPKVEIIRYISGPERTQKGESLACQTEPEAQSQGVVIPQLTVPTTITPYSNNIQLVTSGPLDPHSSRLQGLAKFEKKKPDPLEITLALREPKREKAWPARQNQRPSLKGCSLIRKVKRTLPSPPPEEAHLPITTPPLPQMYMPTLPQKVGPRPFQVTKASLLKDITHELKVVEQESTKLRKQQAELEEEEKEIDAKLRYLELGITQRKDTLLKERERRELAYIRCMGDTRDYMSDSELSNIRIATTYEGNGLLTRPTAAPMNQFSEFTTAQYPTTSSFVTYQYQPTQTAPLGTTTYQQTGFQPPQYQTLTNTQQQMPQQMPQQMLQQQQQPQPQQQPQQQNTFQTHPQAPAYNTQSTFQPPSFAQNQPYQPELGLQNHPGFQPPLSYQAQTTYPSQTSYQHGQNVPFQPQAEILSVHQKPRQTSLADLEQKMSTNYEVISNPTVVVTSTVPEVTYTSTTAANNYGQYKPPETTLADRVNAVGSPTSAYSSESVYTNLEQNIPRNYVMIDDISELTKENSGTSSEMHKPDMQTHSSNGRYGKDRYELSENGNSTRGSSYSRTEEESEEDMYDHHGRGKNNSSYNQRSGDSHGRMVSNSSSVGGGSSYYYDDYKHSSSRDKHGSSMGVQKHSSKNLAPAVVSSKRSKHRKQGMEQKISKFSPIEEAKDVESDMASYTITPSSGGSCHVMSRAKKLQDEITYGLKKNVYDQQKYYGTSSRDAYEEDDRIYSSGRSRSTGYGMDKISSRDSGNHRSKSYERDTMERSQRGSQSRGRPSMRSQNSEEESPLSPVGKPMGVGHGPGGSEPPDSRNQYGSSHSLPDVQDHIKDIPRSHTYKPDDAYIMDDLHCAVSDSEEWSQRDLERNENVKFCRQYIAFHDDKSIVYSGPSGNCTEIKGELLSRDSPSGAMKAVIRECSNKGEEKQFLEIWSKNCKVKSINLTGLKKHGKVFDDDQFGCLVWSHSETHLLYVAEKKRPKTCSFFETESPELSGLGDEVETLKADKKDSVIKGEQFVFYEDWGETLVNKSAPVLCVLDLESNNISVLEGVPENISPGQAFWAANDTGVVFVGWMHEPFRLGLKHCPNRRSSLFYVDLSGGKCDGFTGIYTSSLPGFCWSADSQRVLLNSPQRSRKELLVVDINTGAVESLTAGSSMGSWTLLTIDRDLMVVSCSSPNCPPSLVRNGRITPL